ncbi:lamin tail domain-containing protein [Candidatus Saccharibacteria bacterium]|nr:lamin tail domain-containing protein [Candidatus Saccharibacteria bacterium]
MKKCFIAFILMLFSLSTPKVAAAWAPGDLTIIELKMTGTESMVIENTAANTVNLQNYLVEYFNKSNPATLATPTSAQQLPNITLSPKQSILLNSDNAATCGASAVANLGFSLSDTSGQLAIMRIDSQSDGSLIYRLQDRISWTSATTGADILKVPSNTVDPQAVWYRKLADGLWQQAELNGCSVLLTMVTPSSDTSFVQWASGQEPPVTFVQADDGSMQMDFVPASDLGLSAPMISELLPNPAEPQSDSEDEYIELYNSNDSAFDLTGFKLEIGAATKHFYTFPAGTSIQPKSFVAFLSVDTGLSLTNNGGQAWLLDPLGTVISQTAAYTTAKDGQAWALANGSWRWTTHPTPNNANIITEPLTTKSLSVGGTTSSKKAKTTSPKVKATKTSKSSSAKEKTTKTSPTAFTANNKASAIHPLVLAGIGAAALLYALYEYRNDLANRVYKLRRNREYRVTDRREP